MQIDPTRADAPIPPVRLDMNQVTATALQGKPAPQLRSWELHIECSGQPFTWKGQALSEGMATLKAMAELADSEPTFNKYNARVMASVERSA